MLLNIVMIHGNHSHILMPFQVMILYQIQTPLKVNEKCQEYNNFYSFPVVFPSLGS